MGFENPRAYSCHLFLKFKKYSVWRSWKYKECVQKVMTSSNISIAMSEHAPEKLWYRILCFRYAILYHWLIFLSLHAPGINVQWNLSVLYLPRGKDIISIGLQHLLFFIFTHSFRKGLVSVFDLAYVIC